MSYYFINAVFNGRWRFGLVVTSLGTWNTTQAYGIMHNYSCTKEIYVRRKDRLEEKRFQKIQECILFATAAAVRLRFISLSILLAYFVSMLNSGVNEQSSIVARCCSSAPRQAALNIARPCQKKRRGWDWERRQRDNDGTSTVCLSVCPSACRSVDLTGKIVDHRPPLSGVVSRSPTECWGMLPDVLTTGSWQTGRPVTDSRDDPADLPRQQTSECANESGTNAVYRVYFHLKFFKHFKNSNQFWHALCM